ncbi:MAG: adenosylmethionine--8-amino-7-oxononanoate transaminase [Desulfobacteraceae bacterium]|nr:adenosylmethionine--8-amino-7-oxononanoate transaminase [Desulfobacteraceae bacterium]
MTDLQSMMAFDKKHIWHPYTSMTHPLKTYGVKSARGVKIELCDGKSLIDGMSSWWAAIHGYNHPDLNKAVQDQLEKMAHIMFGGLTHEPAVDLARLLLKITPPDLEHIFFSDSGSVAVEVAIKMAFQYCQARGKPQKNRLITVRSGYHGDTFMAMSVCDPVTGMHSMFKDVLLDHFFADMPEGDSIESMARTIKEHHTNAAAVILEPVVQGAGGMKFYSPRYLTKLKSLYEQYDLLLIFDEIATGFGRTGKLFACEHAGISPDILCLGKALTGGYLTLAATLATTKVAHTISESESGVLMHGPTFMANPLACSTAIASIKLLLSYSLEKMIGHIEQGLSRGLNKLKKLDCVQDVRTLGAIGVVEMKAPVDVEKIQATFVEKGIWIRPFGKLIYTMPPFIINDTDLDSLTGGITRAIHELY